MLIHKISAMVLLLISNLSVAQSKCRSLEWMGRIEKAESITKFDSMTELSNIEKIRKAVNILKVAMPEREWELANDRIYQFYRTPRGIEIYLEYGTNHPFNGRPKEKFVVPFEQSSEYLPKPSAIASSLIRVMKYSSYRDRERFDN